MSDLTQRLVLRAIERGVRAQKALYRPLQAADSVIAQALTTALSTDEKEALGLMLYSGNATYRDHGLHPWEDLWFKADLPKAPAHVLIGAAGAGREAVALANRGYRVTAFDGSASMVDDCRERLSHEHNVLEATFRDVSTQAPAADALHASAPFDAALIGWGSLGHVYDDEALLALVKAMCALCPNGPVMASFPRVTERHGPARATRGARLGRLIGRSACRVLRRESGGHPHESFSLNEGFLRSFDRASIERAAHHAGRRVQFYHFGYPSCTFLPPT